MRGGRRKEVLSTRWRHWNFEPESVYLDEGQGLEGAAEVTFVDTKNGKERILPIPPDVARTIRGLRDIHHKALARWPGPGDHVFLSPQGKPFEGSSMANTLRTFYKILKLAGIPREVDGRTLDLHACRMTFNQRMIRAGVELGTRQAFLGHADPKTTDGMYSDSGGAERFAALQQLVTRELRRQGASAEDIEEALKAICSGTDFSIFGSPSTEQVVTDGDPLGLTDTLPPKQEVTGSNPVGRTNQAGSQLVGSAESRPGVVPEPHPDRGDVEVIQTSALPPGDVLAVGPALLGPHLSQVLVALAQGRSVVLVGSSHSRPQGDGESCDDNPNDRETR